MIGLGTIINVDAEKTRQYYQAMGPGEPCSCNDCKNYCARVKAAYPAAAEYLAGLGVEIEKPLETSPLEPGADGMNTAPANMLCWATARKTTAIQLAGWKCARQGFTLKRV